MASDNCRTQTKTPVAAEVHNTAADMDVVHLMLMVALKAVSTDTDSNVRLRARFLRQYALVLRSPAPICRPNDLFFHRHGLIYPLNGPIAGTRMRVSGMRHGYSEPVPLTIAPNGRCEIVHFGCTSALTAMTMLMYPPVCGRRNSSRFATMQMSFDKRRWCHCMQTAG